MNSTFNIGKKGEPSRVSEATRQTHVPSLEGYTNLRLIREDDLHASRDKKVQYHQRVRTNKSVKAGIIAIAYIGDSNSGF